MDFSDPFVGLTPGRKLTTEEILRALRIDVAAELDAINLYQAHIDAIDDERVRQVIAHIRDEEKEHVAEFLELINSLDPTQRQMFATEHASAIEEGKTGVLPLGVAAAGTSGDTPDDGNTAQPASAQLTVGSLLGEEQT